MTASGPRFGKEPRTVRLAGKHTAAFQVNPFLTRVSWRVQIRTVLSKKKTKKRSVVAFLILFLYLCCGFAVVAFSDSDFSPSPPALLRAFREATKDRRVGNEPLIGRKV